MGAKSFDEMDVAIIQKAEALIEGITANGTSKKKKGPGKKSETEKNDLDRNSDDNPSVNSNIEGNETGKTDSSANVEMVGGKQQEQRVTPSDVDTENVIEISKTIVNFDDAVIKTDLPGKNEAVLPMNQGKLQIDATVADQKIKYPTDVGLLNRSREESERLIDIIYG
jgi:hypothetical protein